MVKNSHGKPRQSNLRRAVSTAYYALFHTLAKCCADSLIGGSGAKRSNAAWHQVYRSLEHGQTKQNCVKKPKILKKFPKDIEDFANTFVNLQIKRHTADYDPSRMFYKSEVLQDIAEARTVMNAFVTTPIKDRRAFAAFVLLKVRD